MRSRRASLLSGEVIAIGEIVGSEIVDDVPSPTNVAFTGVCNLMFVVEDVPTAAFYQIEVGDQVMPLISYEELDASNWNVGYTFE